MNMRKIALVSMAALLLTAALPAMAMAQGRGVDHGFFPQTNGTAPQAAQNAVPGMRDGKGRGGKHGAHGNGQLSELLENNVISQETYDRILESRDMQKYDDMLEKGTITQEEYDAIKKYIESKNAAAAGGTASADLKTTLDSMVEKGVITQAQEDAILADQTPAASTAADTASAS